MNRRYNRGLGEGGAESADLLSRGPGGHGPLAGTPGSISYGGAEGNRIVFVFVGRFDYTAPPTTGQSFNLFTVTQTVTRGLITELGIGSPQYDWFGTNEYYFAINGAPPVTQQYQIANGPGPTGSFLGFLPVGTLQKPYKTRIPIKTNDVVQLIIPAQTVPAASTVQYNIFVRVGGEIYK